MAISLHGLRTVIYPSPDLDAAKAWWTTLLGLEPYFDEPFYVGYSVAGYELGLLPDGAPEDGALTYWGVDDVTEAVRAAVASGATYLVTGDRKHFGDLFGQEVAGVLVLRPAELLATRAEEPRGDAAG